jgi:ubiquinone/menaquinone biosynthesis C-methylase UbiE
MLEVGSGSGGVATAMVEAGYAVTGVDTAEPLVREAHDRCPDGRFVVAEVANLPSPFQGLCLVIIRYKGEIAGFSRALALRLWFAGWRSSSH